MKLYQAIVGACVAARNCEDSGNMAWLERWNARLDAIESELLPRGSGFDAGCRIDRDSTSRKLIIETSFHHMNEGGYYDGWSEHKITITPDLSHGFVTKVSGRDRNGIKDYIADAMQCLDSEFAWESFLPEMESAS